ncbi:MAG: sugar ABC transporter substrate-binding protein [Oscillospiraceae bacterium]|jgi:hypothetical protein
MKKRFLSVLLILSLMITMVLSGCGGTSGEASSGTTSESTSSDSSGSSSDLTHYDIGILPWSLSDTEIVRLMDWCEDIGEELNITFHWVQSSTDETLITNIETLIQAGCDAIMPFYINESVVEVCDENQVYFAQFCSTIEGEVLEAAEASEYWLGNCHENDTASGLAMVQSLYDQGARNFTVIGIPAGQQPIGDARFESFKDGIETLQESDPDVQLLGEYRGLESPDAVENFLSLYPEMDGICNACGGGGRNEAIVQIIDNGGYSDQIRYGCINAVEDYEYWFNTGALDFMVCGQHPDAIFTFVMVYNALTGNRLSDEPIYMNMNYLYVTPDNMEDYSKYIMGDTYPYTMDELKQFIKIFNPDATADMLIEAAANYSVEDVVSRREG